MKTFAALILAIAVALCVIGPAAAKPNKHLRHHHRHLVYTCSTGAMTLYPAGSSVSSSCPRSFEFGGLLVGGPR